MVRRSVNVRRFFTVPRFFTIRHRSVTFFVLKVSSMVIVSPVQDGGHSRPSEGTGSQLYGTTI